MTTQQNTTSTIVGLDVKITVHTTPPQSLNGSLHLLTTTKYNVISNNKQDHNNNIKNNNNNNIINNTNNKNNNISLTKCQLNFYWP